MTITTNHGDVVIDLATAQAPCTVNSFAFLARNSAGSDALKRIFATLLHTLVASAQHNELQLPTSVDGFIRVSQDIIG